MVELSEDKSIETNDGGIMNENSKCLDEKGGNSNVQGNARAVDRAVPRPQPPVLTYRDELDEPQRQDADNAQVANQAKMQKGDLEYGDLADDGRKEHLATAVMVASCSYMTEEDNSFFPVGVEFDPMAKERAHERTIRSVYVACLALLVVALVVGLTVGLAFDEEKESNQSPRESLGIREALEIATGLSLSFANSTQDPSRKPYLQALDWIVHTDPTAPLPADPNLLQRFLMAYLYFATSVEHEWAWCAPPTNYSGDTCSFLESQRFGPGITREIRGSRWLSNTSECFWVGLYCDIGGRIKGISLNGMNMSGTFPEGIQYLTSLTSLRMGVGSLRGPLPTVVAQMDLDELELHSHQFTGTIPSEWFVGTWNRLWSLDVSLNQLAGTIAPEIANWKTMKFLYLQGNKFIGTVPLEIAGLESLSTIYLSDNAFTGLIPRSFGDIVNLLFLSASNNKLTGTIPNELSMAKYLTELHLSKNQLIGTIDSVYKMEKLYALHLDGNQFNGTISPHIAQLTDLEELSVRDNEFTGLVPTELGLLPKLMHMSIAGNNFFGSVPEELCALQLHKADWRLEADCFGNSSLLACPKGCCTICCLPGGTICPGRDKGDAITP